MPQQEPFEPQVPNSSPDNRAQVSASPEPECPRAVPAEAAVQQAPASGSTPPVPEVQPLQPDTLLTAN